MANRFNELLSGLAYNPESFKDMAYTPLLLRQRHDRLLDNQDKMMQDLFNTKVADDPRAQEYFNNKKAELTSQIEGLTQKINSIGAGSGDLMNEFRNMKRGYEKELSLSGGIGQASDIRNQVLAKQLEANKVGLQQKWTPKQIQDNISLENSKYFQDNDFSRLGQDDFTPADYKLTLAPENIDILDSVSRVKPLLGHVSENIGWENIATTVNPETGFIEYHTTGSVIATKDDIKALQEAAKYFNETMLDPNSKEMIAARYAEGNIHPDDHSRDVELRNKMALKIKASLDLQEYKDYSKTTKDQTKVDLPSGYGGNSSATKEEDIPPTLVTLPTGKEVTDIDISDIDNQLAKLEAKEAYTGTDPSMMITQNEVHLKKRLGLLNQRIKQELDPKLHPENVKKADQYIIKNSDFNSVSDAKKYISETNLLINDFHKLQSELVKAQNTNNSQKINSIKNQISNHPLRNSIAKDQYEVKQITKDVNDAIKNAISGSDLNYMQVRTFGTGEEAKKINDILNANANDQKGNFSTLLLNSGGSFVMDEEEYNPNKDESGYLDKLKDLQTVLDGDTKLHFLNLKDSGSTGVTQFEFEYSEAKTGKRGRISIDYDNKSTDTSMLDDWLKTIKNSADPKSKAYIQAVIDNKKTSEISVDFDKKGYSDNQSKILAKVSKNYNKEFDLNDDYKSKNFMDGRYNSYHLELTSDGYHEMYAGSDKKHLGFISAKTWLDREFASYRSIPGQNISADIINNPKNQNEKKLFIKTMIDMAVYSEPDGVIKLGSNQPVYQEKRNIFLKKINSSQGNLEAQREAALDFYKEMTGLKIGHRNKKRFLTSDVVVTRENYYE
jgi:hypothetical protein